MGKSGFVLTILGVAMADSDWLWIPALLVGIGLVLMMKGSDHE